MSILIGLLYVVEVIVCLLLGLVVMLQKPKEGGLGGLAGSIGEQVLGADAGNVLIKATIWLGAIFLINTLVLARFTSTIHARTLMSDEAPAKVEAPAQMPQLPAEPAPAPATAPAAAPAEAPATPAAPVPAPAEAKK